ncbi:MAG: class II glutamine amidotransferase, partial [Marinoscillum sp.]
MCGIVGYLGKKEAYPILINGLKRLEYRGYDSAGIALIEKEEIDIFKKQGKVTELEAITAKENLKSNIGIGHTRWATHGEPNDVNAHPHLSNSRNLALIHNGIIENYGALKEDLTKKGYTFESDTDTEVFVNFIEDIKKKEDLSLEDALRIALSKVIGAYAIAIISKENPTKMVAARKGSPLVLGLGKDEFFLASEATPIIEHTNEVIYLKDEEIVVMENGKYSIKDAKDIPQTPYIQTLELELEAIEKGGHEHFMQKEIFE